MVDAIVNLVLVSLLVVPGFLLLWGFELLTGAKGGTSPIGSCGSWRSHSWWTGF